MGPMIAKEMRYNLHHGDVRGDVLPPPHGSNMSFSLKRLVVQSLFPDAERKKDQIMLS